MTRTAQFAPAAAHSADAPPLLAALLARVRRHLARIEASHDRQARRAGLTARALGDSGRTPEDLLGDTTDPSALPFFMTRKFDL